MKVRCSEEKNKGKRKVLLMKEFPRQERKTVVKKEKNLERERNMKKETGCILRKIQLNPQISDR